MAIFIILTVLQFVINTEIGPFWDWQNKFEMLCSLIFQKGFALKKNEKYK